MPAARRAALVVSVVAGACLALAGCGGSSSSSGGSGTSGGVNIPAGSNTSSPAAVPSGSSALSGKFCTDFQKVGEQVRLPANATNSTSALKKYGVPDLNKVAAYFDSLAAEAPAKPAQELRVIAADYRALAASISSGDTGSLSKVVSKMENLTTNGASGTAFRQLIAYMVTQCVKA